MASNEINDGLENEGVLSDEVDKKCDFKKPKLEISEPEVEEDGPQDANLDVKTEATVLEEKIVCDVNTCNGVTTASSDGRETMSKRQRKKLAKKVQYEANRLERRQKEREKRRLQRMAAREAARLARADESCPSDVVENVKLKKRMSESSCQVRVALDFAYDAEMSAVELNQTNRQAMRCYSENRRAENPLQLYFTQLSDDSLKLCEKHSGKLLEDSEIYF